MIWTNLVIEGAILPSFGTFTLDTDFPSLQAMFLDVLSIVLVSPTHCF